MTLILFSYPVCFLYFTIAKRVVDNVSAQIKLFAASNDVYSYLYEEKLRRILISHSYYGKK